MHARRRRLRTPREARLPARIHDAARGPWSQAQPRSGHHEPRSVGAPWLRGHLAIGDPRPRWGAVHSFGLRHPAAAPRLATRQKPGWQVRRQTSARANTLWQRDRRTGLQSWRRSTVGKALGHYRIANQLCASVENQRELCREAKYGFQLQGHARRCWSNYCGPQAFLRAVRPGLMENMGRSAMLETRFG